MFALALALAGSASMPGCIVGVCSFVDHVVRPEILPPSHVAIFSITGSGGRDVSVSLEGTLENESQDVDCPTAIYRFEEEPQPDAIPRITFADPAPDVLNGGGFLLLETALPAQRDEADVPRELEDLTVHEGDGAFERWLVVATCGDAPIDTALTIVSYVCARGNDDPPPVEVLQVH